VAGRLFSLGTQVSSTNKTDHHDNWNIVESGIKHHISNPILFYIRLENSWLLGSRVVYKENELANEVWVVTITDVF
jgi:hypothetical protein